MGKSTPESFTARETTEDDQFGAERYFFAGSEMSLEGFSKTFGGNNGAGRRVAGRAKMLEGSASPLGSGGKMTQKESVVDFGDAIGKELQSLYDDVVAQPVPDRFLSLLNQLEKNVVSSGRSNSAPMERK